MEALNGLLHPCRAGCKSALWVGTDSAPPPAPPQQPPLDDYTFTKEISMVQTDFRTALQGTDEIEITVTGRTSGRSFSYPVWFVQEGEKLYLLPGKGPESDWYKNLRKTPTIPLAAKGKTFTTSATLITDEALVREVVEKFRDKYGAGTVNTLYSRLDAAVEVPLK